LAKEIAIVRGNDVDLTIRTFIGSRPFDITEVAISCKVKDRPGGTLLYAPAIIKTDPSRGEFRVRFPKTVTVNWPVGGKVYFDFRFVFPDGSEKNFPVPPLVGNIIEPVTDP
jgi:hypothetical protein